MEGRLKKQRDIVYRDILSTLKSISSYLFLFGKDVFMCPVNC